MDSESRGLVILVVSGMLLAATSGRLESVALIAGIVAACVAVYFFARRRWSANE